MLQIIEIHPALKFLSAIFDKEVAYSTINSAKCIVVSIIYIPFFPTINEYPLVMKHMTAIFDLRSPKPELSNAYDVDILFMDYDRLGDNALLANVTLIQKCIVLLLSYCL